MTNMIETLEYQGYYAEFDTENPRKIIDISGPNIRDKAYTYTNSVHAWKDTAKIVIENVLK